MLGITLALSGVYLFNKSLIMNYFWLPFALVFIEVLRRRYVYPRTGYAKPSISGTEVIGIFGILILGLALLAALVQLIAISMDQPIKGNWREIVSFALILLAVIFFCFIAYRFSVPRWYMHGITMGIVFTLSKTFDAAGLVLGLGIWITLVGGYVFLRFLNQYPIGETPVSDEVSDAD
jgi:hypothetical protein